MSSGASDTAGLAGGLEGAMLAPKLIIGEKLPIICWSTFPARMSPSASTKKKTADEIKDGVPGDKQKASGKRQTDLTEV